MAWARGKGAVVAATELQPGLPDFRHARHVIFLDVGPVVIGLHAHEGRNGPEAGPEHDHHGVHDPVGKVYSNLMVDLMPVNSQARGALQEADPPGDLVHARGGREGLRGIGTAAQEGDHHGAPGCRQHGGGSAWETKGDGSIAAAVRIHQRGVRTAEGVRARRGPGGEGKR